MMKKGVVISIVLIVLGLAFECIHFATDFQFYEIPFWALGLIFTVLGVLGILWYIIVPLLEDRAEQLGKFKKKGLRKK